MANRLLLTLLTLLIASCLVLSLILITCALLLILG